MLPAINLHQRSRPGANDGRQLQLLLQCLVRLSDDHQSELTLSSLNQNNCLEYTIVNDLQFQADSLVSRGQADG